MPKARHTDPVTSHDAAKSVRNLTATQQRIVNLLRFPMTDEELIDSFFVAADISGGYASPSGIRSRRAELVFRGVVVDTGERVKLRSGRHAIVWKTA